MPNVWPATLPQSPQLGWQERKQPNYVKTETDTGPEKRRRRFTRSYSILNLPMVLTASQLATLRTFHTDTLSDGVLPFDMAHPETGISHSFHWVNDFAYVESQRGLFRVSIELRYFA